MGNRPSTLSIEEPFPVDLHAKPWVLLYGWNSPFVWTLFLSQLASYFYVSAGPHDAAAMEHWRAIEAQKALDYNLEELLFEGIPPKITSVTLDIPTLLL